MDKDSISYKVFDKMYQQDALSKDFGMEIVDIFPGNCTLSMIIKPTMLNGFQIAHGSITYALADSALAFAANSYGEKAVSIETSISHSKAVGQDERIIAKTEEMNRTKRTALYYVTITNEIGEKVAFFKGTVFLTGKFWDL
jgi:acyl-CoA thioesterase